MGTSCCRSPLPAEIRGLYKRRRPEKTDLYKLLLDQLETFFAHYDKRFLQRHGHLRPEIRRTLKEFYVPSAPLQTRCRTLINRGPLRSAENRGKKLCCTKVPLHVLGDPFWGRGASELLEDEENKTS